MTELKKRYFIVGTEGSGHHLFVNSCDIKEDKQLLHWASDDYNTKNYDKEENINEDLSEGLVLASFPYNLPTNAVRRPNIMNYIHWIGCYKEDKIIWIYRDPVMATLSRHKRFGYTKGTIGESARIILDNMIYITSCLKFYREHYCSMPLVFRYEDICDAPEEFLRWTGIILDKDKIEKSTKTSIGEIQLKDYFFQNYELYSFFEKCIIEISR